MGEGTHEWMDWHISEWKQGWIYSYMGEWTQDGWIGEQERRQKEWRFFSADSEIKPLRKQDTEICIIFYTSGFLPLIICKDDSWVIKRGKHKRQMRKT